VVVPLLLFIRSRIDKKFLSFNCLSEIRQILGLCRSLNQALYFISSVINFHLFNKTKGFVCLKDEFSLKEFKVISKNFTAGFNFFQYLLFWIGNLDFS